MTRTENAKQPDEEQQVNWEFLMNLFEQLRRLPESERQSFLDRECPNQKIANRLISMMSSLDHTESFIDTPLTSRITTKPDWLAENWVGKKFNDFELIELLHAGSIAAVFKARQKDPVTRDVALKMIRPDAPAGFIERFRLEQTALAKLTHPNIATIHSVGTTEQGQPYLVMEYISGQTLTPHCDQNRLDIDQRLALFLQVCDAVSFSHQRGVMHRDIKSSNILIRRLEGEEIPIVIDFGISSHLNQTISGTNEQSMGTPEYMSPEHFNDIGETDIRADVYSLGMVLFNLLAGKIPFDRGQFLQSDYTGRRSMILAFQPRPPSQTIADLSEDELQRVADQRGVSSRRYHKQLTMELDWIYQKATHKELSQRHQSVSELARDIRHYLNKEVIEAQPVSHWYRLVKFTQRHVAISLATAVGSVFTAVFLASTIYQNQQIKAQFLRAEEQKVVAEYERSIAENERDIAKQVTDLIADIFTTVDPFQRAKSEPVSIELMLENSARQIGNQPNLVAPVKYKLLQTVAQVYEGIGQPSEALKITEQILSRPDWPNIEADIEANILASVSSAHSGEHKKGLAFAKTALDLSMSASEESELLAKAKLTFASASLFNGQYSVALPLLKESLDIYRARYDTDNLKISRALLILGQAYGYLEKLDESETAFGEALVINQKLLGKNHPTVLRNQTELATIIARLGRLDEALALYESAHEKYLEVLGETHPKMAASLNNLASVYAQSNKTDKALEISNKLVPQVKIMNGEASMPYLITTMNHSNYLRLANKNEEALTWANTALALANTHFPENKTLIPTAKYAVGAAHFQLENLEVASRLLVEVYQDLAAALGENNLRTVNALALKSRINIKLGRYNAAEQEASTAKSLYEKLLTQGDWRTELMIACELYAKLQQQWVEETYKALLRSEDTLSQMGSSRHFETLIVKDWVQASRR